MAAHDNLVLVNSSGGAVTITLPAPTNGRVLIVKDSTGSAYVNNITINPNASETIDGASSFVITSNWGECQLQSDGTNWFTNLPAINGDISFSLTASTTAVASQLTFDSRKIKGELINYCVFDGTNRKTGVLKVACDQAIGTAATVARITDNGVSTGTMTISWTAAISGNNCQLSYTTGSGTYVMDAYVQTFKH